VVDRAIRRGHGLQHAIAEGRILANEAPLGPQLWMGRHAVAIKHHSRPAATDPALDGELDRAQIHRVREAELPVAQCFHQPIRLLVRAAVAFEAPHLLPSLLDRLADRRARPNVRARAGHPFLERGALRLPRRRRRRAAPRPVEQTRQRL